MKKKFGYGPGGKLVRDRTMEYGLQGDSSCRFSYKYLSEQELQPHLFNKLRGGFDTKLFVEWIEFDNPSGPHEFYEYCLSNPEKYPKL